MPVRDWLRWTPFIVAQFSAILILAAVGLEIASQYQAQRETYQEYQQRAKAEQRETAEQIAKQCSVGEAPIAIAEHCLAEKLIAYQERDATNKDLQAQQDMAFLGQMAFLFHHNRNGN